MKVAAAALIEVAPTDVAVGDLVIFGDYDRYNPDFFFVIDADPAVRVDALGVHFAAGTYIPSTDHNVLIAADHEMEGRSMKSSHGVSIVSDGDLFVAKCRCGWRSDGFDSRREAHDDHAEHVFVAYALDDTTVKGHSSCREGS